MGATIAIGDVHGNRAALDDLLGKLLPELQRGDTVVFLGDYVDRGPDTKGCIDSILSFRDRMPGELVTLVGNHEDWLLRTLRDPRRHSWLIGMEGLSTVASYSTQAAELLRSAAEAAGPRLVLDAVTLPYEEFFRTVPENHLDFFGQLRLFHRTAGAVFVHGGLDPNVASLEAQPRQAMVWGTSDFVEKYTGPETVVYGHWDNARLDERGWPSPAYGPKSVGIDTISHGVLTAFRWPDRRVFQSRRFS